MLSINTFTYFISRLTLLTLFTFLFFNITINPQSKLKSKISTGLTALYNFNFKTAEKTFDDIIKNDPENPAGYHYKSISSLWFYLDSKNEYDLNNFYAFTDTAIKNAEIFLERDSSDVFILYILGSVLC